MIGNFIAGSNGDGVRRGGQQQQAGRRHGHRHRQKVIWKEILTWYALMVGLPHSDEKSFINPFSTVPHRAKVPYSTCDGYPFSEAQNSPLVTVNTVAVEERCKRNVNTERNKRVKRKRPTLDRSSQVPWKPRAAIRLTKNVHPEVRHQL